MINLKCSNCGGDINLDNSREFGFCNYCGHKILVKEDIIQNNYNTTQHITKHIYGHENKDVDELLKDGEKLFELRDIHKAHEKFEKAVEIEPTNWLAWAWYGRTGGKWVFGKLDDPKNDKPREMNFLHAYKNAYKLAPDENAKDKVAEFVLTSAGSNDERLFGFYIEIKPNDWQGYFFREKCSNDFFEKMMGGRLSDMDVFALPEKTAAAFQTAYNCAKNANDKEGLEIITKYLQEKSVKYPDVKRKKSCFVLALEMIGEKPLQAELINNKQKSTWKTRSIVFTGLLVGLITAIIVFIVGISVNQDNETLTKTIEIIGFTVPIIAMVLVIVLSFVIKKIKKS